ncbi:hypothetical protein D6D17_03885 [Aureobasidium pullulans]|uniref:Uncharacterized protein n=2 Tax=Aureobasidium pullulans TaxID=5580 RepID=A0A074YDF7_AURPU|nr:uncharacterized protein M438DRAFT_334739 [Aureobasidium pullulans EXF-150]KAG2164974.1 hypothetical protein JADG_004713 [Aureobasidium pullulans]KEQ84886.1 hypothetical protein M438DRAFT_334739 [Aureobasidium pullulans EXF-150]THV96637.1 hypothetical protein D6D27_02573 [Aureobasidium pullulans]THW02304.1 hypothetical protein D6D26_04408 [Aureobasidium pullulans]THW11421.1 hypothetical protein D6D24_07228 [Aureobasidium pullulans]
MYSARSPLEDSFNIQQHSQPTSRPALSRRPTLLQQSGLYTPASPEANRSSRSYFSSGLQNDRSWPSSPWPTTNPRDSGSSVGSTRLSSAGGLAVGSQRSPNLPVFPPSPDYYSSSISSNPYTTAPPPGFNTVDMNIPNNAQQLQQLQQLQQQQIQQQLQQQQQQQQQSGMLHPNYNSAAMGNDGGAMLPGSSHRRSSGRDEFDGPHQLLAKPTNSHLETAEAELIQLPVSLYAEEQDSILTRVNDRLSQCAYDFVAKYQFPIPLEPDKRPVRVPADREWTEWCYLLKRLATKRRIPARVLYNGQIKQLVTVLENSLEMRHAAKHQSRPLKDDRNVLQLISAGLQVSKMLKDPDAMRYLDELYVAAERLIESRRGTPSST